MPPQLAELLGLENPFPTGSIWPNEAFAYTPAQVDCMEHRAYNRALKDAWEKMEPWRISPGEFLVFWREGIGKEWALIRVRKGPGYLVWIPEREEKETPWMGFSLDTTITSTSSNIWTKVQVVNFLPHPQQWAIEGW